MYSILALLSDIGKERKKALHPGDAGSHQERQENENKKTNRTKKNHEVQNTRDSRVGTRSATRYEQDSKKAHSRRVTTKISPLMVESGQGGVIGGGPLRVLSCKESLGEGKQNE